MINHRLSAGDILGFYRLIIKICLRPEHVILARWIVKVFGWDPRSFFPDEQMPDAGYPVDKEQQQTQQLKHPNTNLQPLLKFHVSDDPTKTKESDQLQKTKELEFSIGSFAIDDHKPRIQIL